ncbi:hypothetical protein OHQ88_33635 (plasmid) [Micromonospora zamorensis]|uniref:hypothetical protein n=1 Tax=Micromonospora zamorensis TaxID=709883 RepID=UPI002E2279C3
MTITTAARRMTRELNQQSAGWRCYFDADGHLVQRIYGPEPYGPRRDEYVHGFVAHQEPNVQGAPLHRWTWREVQKAIDEAAEREAMMDAPTAQQVLDEWAAEMVTR